MKTMMNEPTKTKVEYVKARVTEPFVDPYTGAHYIEGQVIKISELDKIGWKKADIKAATSTNLLVEVK